MKQSTEEGRTPDSNLLAKAHYRMALACFELGLKDQTAFGPAIYFKTTMQMAEEAWNCAQGSAVLQSPITGLLGRLRMQLRKQQQQMANQQPNESETQPLVEPQSQVW